MPVYKRSGRNKKGTLFFVYDITGDSIGELAERMSMNADQPIEYRGRYNDGQLKISAFQVEELINGGGQVACQTSVDGVSCIARILEPYEITVIPSDGNKSTADYLVGANDDDDFDDYDDGDDFEDEYDDEYSHNMDRDDYRDVRQQEKHVDPRVNGMPSHISQMDPDMAEQTEKKIGVGEWFLTLILLMVPVVNIVFIIILLANKKTNKTKKSFIIADLILMVIQIALASLIVLLGGASTLQAIITGQAQNSQNQQSQVQQNSNQQEQQSSDQIGTSSSSTNVNGVSSETMNAANGGSSQSDGSMSVVQFGDSSSSGTSRFTAALDNIAIVDKANGGKVAIVTITVANGSNDSITPAGVLDVTGHQGNINLTPYMEAQDSFKPETFTSSIAPSSSGTFQVGYELSNDDKFRIMVLDKNTRATLLDQSQS